jgi:probable rRNA maturation factor
MMGSPVRALEIANRQRRAWPRRAAIAAPLDHLLEEEVEEERRITIAFVGERTMRRLNRDWMGEDRATDVLSFPSEPGPDGLPAALVPAGEVIVCIPTCERQARTRGVPFHDEIARMLIHGALHVLGYDHRTSAQKRRMRPRERRYLSWCRRQGLRVMEIR